MPVQIPVPENDRRISASDAPRGVVAMLACVCGAASLAGAWLLPSPIVLPALSVAAVVAAMALAAVAWRRPRNPHSLRVTYWDVAGALTLVGICAALLSDPEAVIPLLESQHRP